MIGNQLSMNSMPRAPYPRRARHETLGGETETLPVARACPCGNAVKHRATTPGGRPRRSTPCCGRASRHRQLEADRVVRLCLAGELANERIGVFQLTPARGDVGFRRAVAA